eukprot:jgi/Mesen1/3972/ME000210S03217
MAALSTTPFLLQTCLRPAYLEKKASCFNHAGSAYLVNVTKASTSYRGLCLEYLHKKHVKSTLHPSGLHRVRSLWENVVPYASIAGAEHASTVNNEELVDRLLNLVEGSDGGVALGEDGRKSAADYILALEAAGMEEPLKSPLIFGEWEVVYTSSPTAAGGSYRSSIGRTLFKTKEMVQTISAPDRVGNRVKFDALALIPGKVALEGVFKPMDDKWVEVFFEPPTFDLGPLHFAYGKNTSVKLSTIYLDERIRVGRGSSGSLFVFKRRQE